MATTKKTVTKSNTTDVKALKADIESIQNTLDKIHHIEINNNSNLNAIGVFTLIILAVEFFRLLHSLLNIR